MTTRAITLTWKIEIGGHEFYPTEIDEFVVGGEPGSNTVRDGNKEYEAKNNIRKADKVGFVINKKRDKIDYDVCKNYDLAGKADDIFVSGEDASGTVVDTFLFESCEIGIEKKNKGDNSSTETQKFNLSPLEISEV